MRRRLKRLGRWMLRLIALAAVVAVVAGAYFYDYPRVAADLPEAVLAYRDAGLPWTAKDVAPHPPVRDEENAAPLLRAADKAWPHHEKTEDGVARTVYDDRIGEATMYGEPVAPFLPAVARALALAHEAAGRPRLDFGRDWDLGSSLQMPEESRVKALVKAFVARANLRAQKGDDAGAVSDLIDAQRLGALIGSEPSIISALVGVACDRIAMAAALDCLGATGGDARRIAIYREWLARPTAPFNLRRALRGEIYCVVTRLRNFDRMGIGTSWNFVRDQNSLMCDVGEDETDWTLDAKTVRREGYSDLQRPRAYLARALRQWAALADRTDGLNASVDRITEAATALEAESYGRVPTLSGIFDTITFPVFGQFGRCNHRVQAGRTLALLYADALLQHARTGTWPESSTVPDPLGESVFGMRVDPGGRFHVWSVGDNGVDDGGLARSETADLKRSSDDLVAAYPPIPKRYSKRPTPGRGGPPFGFRVGSGAR